MVSVSEILCAVETNSYAISIRAGNRKNLRALVIQMKDGGMKVHLEINPSDFREPRLVIEASIGKMIYNFVWARVKHSITLIEAFMVVPAIQIADCLGRAA